LLKELYTAALGMLPQQTRLEVIANNMANANTTGFKRSGVFERNLIDARSNFYNVPGDAEQNDPPVGSYTDFSSGSLQKTDNPLDMALENPDNFFVVQDADGGQVYTKGGNFTLDEDGTIIGEDGKKLMGANGPINVGNEVNMSGAISGDQKKPDIRISQQGEISINSQEIGSVLVAKIDNPQTLENISNSDFIATQDTNVDILPQEEVKIKQGYLENSNVNIIKEMIDMIELQRMFETGSRVITTNDSTLDSSLQIGRFF
jgi:flagellar basal-body rod protein FlgF